ncbi:unknown [Mycoplasma sp. CAG:776]|nr:unknown [Mycoplasma sp. CAG:776]
MIDGSQSFNSSYDRSQYVGYMYRSGHQQHGNTDNSVVKTVVDNWYNNNLKSYEEFISIEAGFCGDREVANGYEWSTTGSTHNYAGYERLVTNKTPMLKCGNNADLYTIGGSSTGNHALTNPIGLITADEVAMAGGVYGNVNNNYYLYNGEYYWTMTPSKYPDANVFYVWSNGSFSHANVASMYGVRPVINLAHDVEITGSGTSSDPFVVKGAE